MPLLRKYLLGVLTLLVVCSVHAQSIWKWRDARGSIQISDRAPPPDVPDKDILSRPHNARLPAAASSPGPSASGLGLDPELEARKRKLALEEKDKASAAAAKASEAAKAKADTRAAMNADACQRARNQLLALEGGQRFARVNSKGEREVLDDKERDQEAARLRQIVGNTCP